MWIVVMDWDRYEANTLEFESEVDARRAYDSYLDETSSTMYLAEVKDKNKE